MINFGRCRFLKGFLVAAFLVLPIAASAGESASDQQRPNILWITIEDWSADLSCYGTAGMHTPHVDQLAAEGIRYNRAFTSSPVCSARIPCRATTT